MRTSEEWAAVLGVSPRTVTRWCVAGRVPGAAHVDGRWRIPLDAEPPADRRASKPRPLARQAWSDVALVTRDGAVAAAAAPAPAPAPSMWMTVDDVAAMWAPHVSRHAVLGMLRAGELRGYRRGPNRSWIIPVGAVREVIA